MTSENGRASKPLLSCKKKEKVLHMYKLSPQPEHKELFVTSYSRHAPVGGKQGGIQPGCNQYQSFYMLVSFLWGSDLFMDSSAVATKSRSPVVLGSTR